MRGERSEKALASIAALNSVAKARSKMMRLARKMHNDDWATISTDTAIALLQARTRQRQQAAPVEEASGEGSPAHVASQSAPQAPDSTGFMDAVASEWALAPCAVRTAERMLERPRWQGGFSLLDVWEDSQAKFADYQSWQAQRESPRAPARWSQRRPHTAIVSGRTATNQSKERPVSARTMRAHAHWQRPRPHGSAVSPPQVEALQHPSLLRAQRVLEEYRQQQQCDHPSRMYTL